MNKHTYMFIPHKEIKDGWLFKFTPTPLSLDYTFPARYLTAPDIGLEKLNVGSGVLISIPHTELKVFL